MNYPFPWNGSELLRKEYEKDNCIITRTGASTGRVIIFFSSNGIYFPNNEEGFTDRIIRRDYYDFKNLSSDRLIHDYYELVILVRDVYKQWYVNGINPRYDSIDKTAEFLREITSGLKVTTCGSSAGGYAAVLFAHLLKAERFFSMSGQFSIWHQADPSVAPFIYENASCPEKNKYYDISRITLDGGGYYFWPSECENDKAQYELVKDSPQITILSFKSKQHGVPFPYCCYPYILSRSSAELSSIFSGMKKNVPLRPNIFALKILPITLYPHVVPGIIRRFIKKIHRGVKKVMRKLKSHR